MGGGEGVFRMFNSVLGGQISWLLPLALVGLVGGLWLTRHDGRTGLLPGGMGAVGRMAAHAAHRLQRRARASSTPYYTVVMAPAVAALAGAGSSPCGSWAGGRCAGRGSSRRPSSVRRCGPPVLLDRTRGYHPGSARSWWSPGSCRPWPCWPCGHRSTRRGVTLVAGGRGHGVTAGRAGRPTPSPPSTRPRPPWPRPARPPPRPAPEGPGRRGLPGGPGSGGCPVVPRRPRRAAPAGGPPAGGFPGPGREACPAVDPARPPPGSRVPGPGLSGGAGAARGGGGVPPSAPVSSPTSRRTRARRVPGGRGGLHGLLADHHPDRPSGDHHGWVQRVRPDPHAGPVSGNWSPRARSTTST